MIIGCINFLLKNKIILLSLILFHFLTLNLYGAVVLDGFYDQENDELTLDIVYSGGCVEHDFYVLPDTACMESFPMQQNARLIDEGEEDPCDGIIYTTGSFSLADNEDFCRPAYLTIYGDNNSSVTLFVSFQIYNGRLISHYAIGGETTGIAIVTEGDKVYELILPVRLRIKADTLINQYVEVIGRYKVLSGVETEERHAIEVMKLQKQL